MKISNRVVSLLLAVIMVLTFTLPVSAQEIEPLQDIYSVSESDGVVTEAPTEAETDEDSGEEATVLPEIPQEDESESTDAPTGETEATTDSSAPDEESTEAATDPVEETEPTEATEPATSDVANNGSFLLDCTPEQAEAIIAFYEALAAQIENPPIRPYVSDGDSGSVSWTWGESVGIDVPSGDSGNPYHIGNIPRITLSTSDMPIGRPFCAEFGPDPGGSYTASEGGDSDVLALLVAFENGDASAVGVQLALWYIFDGSAT